MDALAELRNQITRLAARPSEPSWAGRLIVFATDRTTEPLGTVTEPVFALVAQGSKRSMLGDQVFDYSAGQYLVVTVDLPLIGEITAASIEEPFLAFGLPLKPAVIAQLLLDAGPMARKPEDSKGIIMSDASEELLDAVVRFLRLVDSADDYKILGPALEREVHWRLMNGSQAATVRQIGLADSRLALVGRATRWIQGHFDQVIRIDDLAEDVGMSVSSLNRQFRAVTTLSPLQYQKQLRLQKARIQLIADSRDVASIGYSVGYDSPSQFSREYRRMFGSPPGEDAARLQSMDLTTL
jgi:AraC-like DNA-binding protein